MMVDLEIYVTNNCGLCGFLFSSYKKRGPGSPLFSFSFFFVQGRVGVGRGRGSGSGRRVQLGERTGKKKSILRSVHALSSRLLDTL